VQEKKIQKFHKCLWFKQSRGDWGTELYISGCSVQRSRWLPRCPLTTAHGCTAGPALRVDSLHRRLLGAFCARTGLLPRLSFTAWRDKCLRGRYVSLTSSRGLSPSFVPRRQSWSAGAFTADTL